MNTQSSFTSSPGYDEISLPDELPNKRRKRSSTKPREIGIMRKPLDGSASFLGSSSGIHFIHTVYNAFARRSEDLKQARLVPGEDDQLHEHGNELWSKDELDYQPSGLGFNDLVRWTRSYFENWHPMFPHLNAPAILHILEQISHFGLASVSRNDAIIIRSIVSISLMDQRQVNAGAGPVPANLIFRTVGHAMESLQILLSEPTTIQLLQAAFSVELLFVSMLRLNAASRIGGVVTRTAFHLGLHRCPARFSCFSQEDVDIRRRVFWSIYCLERYLSQALGVPLSIKDDDIDVCYPGTERHQQPTVEDNRLRLLRHLAKFAKVRGLVLELRNKSILHSRDSTTSATEVNSELAHWWNSVYDDVNPVVDGDAESQDRLRPFHRLVLDVLRHESIISMNRPLLATATEGSTPETKAALQSCIESSRSLITDLARHLTSNSKRFQENEPEDVPLVWPSFTWAVWMGCLILMYAAWEREFPVQAASRYAKLSLSILENLSLRGSSWPKTCIEAIRDIESALSKAGNNTHMAPPRDQSIRFHATDHLNAPTDRPVWGASVPNSSDQHDPTVQMPAFDVHTAQGSNGNPVVSTTTGQISRQIPPGILADESMTDSAGSGCYNSAGLIFGDSSLNGFPSYNSAFQGQDGLSGLGVEFESIFTNDFWSVADGPWLIHENGL